jgi:hypothetical protein
MPDNRKKDRVWNDPPFLDGIQPKMSDPATTQSPAGLDPISKRRKFIFIGLIYLFIGIAVEVGMLLGLPLEILPFVLTSCGVIFILLGLILFRKGE